MKCGKPKIVLDVSNRISSYGENRLELKLVNDVLFVNIFFEGGDNLASELVLCFEHSVYYSFQSMPGVKMNNMVYNHHTENFTRLVEFEFSEAVNNWEKHYNNMFKFKHFSIFFENENKYLEIISKNFKIIESEFS